MLNERGGVQDRRAPPCASSATDTGRTAEQDLDAMEQPSPFQRSNLPGAKRPDERSRAPAVTSAMKILDYLAVQNAEAGLSEIARALELSKSYCFNILSTLASGQFVVKDRKSVG